MERSDERLSTRDLASGSTAAGTEAERDSALADPAGAPADDAGAVRADTDEAAALQDDRTRQGEPRFERGTEAASTGEGVYDRDETDAATGGRDMATTDRDMETTGDRDTMATTGADTRDATASAGSGTDMGGALLDDSDQYQRQWEQIQGRFVDEPRGAVEDADALVATVMQRLAEGFAQERERLEAQWGRGEDISTEDLRVALQRYRSFFQRLLST
jgi:hypothetical protein